MLSHPMRRAVLALAAALLLVGPTAIAFFAGGFFEEPRLTAGLIAWALVLVVAFAAPLPLPASRAGRAAVAGLVLLTVWSAASLAWAPLAGPAVAAVERLLLYLAALVAAIGLLRRRGARTAVEPVLALGALVVIGFGLTARLLPELLHQEVSWTAGDRLERPLTYWNAQGLLAAMGFVLCVRIAGSHLRPVAMRVAAAAACAPLAAGVYLSLSRGAIAAAIVGLAVLIAAAPTRAQLRAVAVALATGIAAAAVAAAAPGVTSLSGTPAERQRDGAVVLALLLLIMLAAGVATRRSAGAEHRVTRTLPFAARLPAVAAGIVALAVAALVIGGLGERAGNEDAERAASDRASRLTSVSSNRYEYWRVATRAFAEDPLKGTGAGGFRVVWLQERPIPESVRDVHSLPLELAGELGVLGLVGLALLAGGVGVAARRAVRRDAAAAAGAIAVCTTWALHASIDWDWQMPAVTLPVLVLAGGLVALGEERAQEPPPVADPPRTTDRFTRTGERVHEPVGAPVPSS
jgi:O-antigen ligase